MKAIKKKKYDKVEAFKERFREGYAKYLKETEHASEADALKVVDNVWGIIESSASYLFNVSHAFCVSNDSLYIAYLKAHYPYETYYVLLRIWDEKKKKDKVAAVISEMKRYKGINMTVGQFSQDNRDWVVDKESKTISQSLSSIRFMNKKIANQLYDLGRQSKAYMGTVYSKVKNAETKRISVEEALAEAQAAMSEEEYEAYKASVEGKKFITKEITPAEYSSVDIEEPVDCFTNLLRAVQMNTALDARQIVILIELGYFKQFGGSGKLMKVYNEFFDGENKLTKSIKSFVERLEKCREYEKTLPDEELPYSTRLYSEMSNVGLCLTVDSSAPGNLYFVVEVDAKYGVKCKMYSVPRGSSGIIRFRKDDFAKKSFKAGDCIELLEFNKSPKYIYKGGEKTRVPNEYDIWAKNYKVVYSLENKGD